MTDQARDERAITLAADGVDAAARQHHEDYGDDPAGVYDRTMAIAAAIRANPDTILALADQHPNAGQEGFV
jgi:hypothetical protein